jgi:hypothetical protein
MNFFSRFTMTATGMTCEFQTELVKPLCHTCMAINWDLSSFSPKKDGICESKGLPLASAGFPPVQSSTLDSTRPRPLFAVGAKSGADGVIQDVSDGGMIVFLIADEAVPVFALPDAVGFGKERA